MSHFAKIDNGLVTSVIVADQEFVDGQAGTWVQTSYNTRGGVHYAPNSNESDSGIALRKNYAGIGYTYDKIKDAFIAPQPYPSWLLDDETCQWNAPVPEPDDDKWYGWNESTTNWVEINYTP